MSVNTVTVGMPSWFVQVWVMVILALLCFWVYLVAQAAYVMLGVFYHNFWSHVLAPRHNAPPGPHRPHDPQQSGPQQYPAQAARRQMDAAVHFDLVVDSIDRSAIHLGPNATLVFRGPVRLSGTYSAAH